MKSELVVLCAYFALLMLVARFSYRKVHSSSEFVLGNRSLNFWLTAFSAHASDMSGWLFMGYPALVFEGGVFAAWTGIGLCIGMFLNWHYIAPRLRALTEQMGSLTLSHFFESRFNDRSGKLRLLASVMSIFFFTCYISSGLSALGILSESLFGIEAFWGMVFGVAVVLAYILSGGYRTVAWLDLFQGFFLLGVILFVPWYLLGGQGGISGVMQATQLKGLTTSLVPSWDWATGWSLFTIAAGWGLGYFGQPQILTKYMGIAETKHMHKAKYLGMSWQLITVGAATVLGLLGVSFFPQGLADSQQVILEMVKTTLPTFLVGLVLCAIAAATTNVMAAHLLIVAANLSEDVYKPLFRPNASGKELLTTSRLAAVTVILISLGISLMQLGSIYYIVLYAWSGLGASFGPLVLVSLYKKRLYPQAGLVGIVTGGVIAAVWPSFSSVPAIIPAFVLSLLAIGITLHICERASVLPEQDG